MSHLLTCCSKLEAHALAGRANRGLTLAPRSGGRLSLRLSRSIPSLSRSSGPHMLAGTAAAAAEAASASAASSASCQRSPAAKAASEQLMAPVAPDASRVLIVDGSDGGDGGGGGRQPSGRVGVVAPSVSAMSNVVGVCVARAAAGTAMTAAGDGDGEGRCAVRGPGAAAPLGHAPPERHHLNRTTPGESV